MERAHIRALARNRRTIGSSGSPSKGSIPFSPLQVASVSLRMRSDRDLQKFIVPLTASRSFSGARNVSIVSSPNTASKGTKLNSSKNVPAGGLEPNLQVMSAGNRHRGCRWTSCSSATRTTSRARTGRCRRTPSPICPAFLRFKIVKDPSRIGARMCESRRSYLRRTCFFTPAPRGIPSHSKLFVATSLKLGFVLPAIRGIAPSFLSPKCVSATRSEASASA